MDYTNIIAGSSLKQLMGICTHIVIFAPISQLADCEPFPGGCGRSGVEGQSGEKWHKCHIPLLLEDAVFFARKSLNENVA